MGTTKGFKDDGGKPRYDLIPVLALEELAKVLTIGAIGHKEAYDDENWRRVDNANRRFYSAAQRHIAEVRKGNSWDNGEKGTNCHHYACAISSLMFLLQKELEEHQKSLEEVQFNDSIEKELEGQQSKSEEVWSWQFAEKEYYRGFGNVKPEASVELEYGSGKYITKHAPHETCRGCAFDSNSTYCESSLETLDCVDSKIIWVKKETN